MKFTSDFFQAYARDVSNASLWFKEAAFILSHYNQLPGDIISHDLDRQHIYTLIDLILKESQSYNSNSMRLIQHLMICILEVLVRNIKKGSLYELKDISEQDERIHRLLNYIHEHIFDPSLLKIEHLASTFSLSPTYLGEYFRKKVNISLREYIIKTKLKWVEIRLLNSTHNLTEIADELNFTDVSHLSKIFKKYVGISIREFKKQGEYRILKRNAC